MAAPGSTWFEIKYLDQSQSYFVPFVQYLSDLGTRADWRQMADVSQGSRNTTFKSGENFHLKCTQLPFYFRSSYH